MILRSDEHLDLPTPTGPMRTHLFRPVAPGRYPALVFYSEIFQVTAPIRRFASALAGHGYLVAVPEVYHEYEPSGTVLPYDQPGSDRGNFLKTHKPVAAYDSDAKAVLNFLATHPASTGVLGAMGICLGGHLAFRAALDPRIRATVCFYATDLHTATLGEGKQDDSLTRAGEIQGELFLAWGRQDPHIPTEARMAILTRLNALNLTLNWHEVNGAHAFLRDEGPRYDPDLAHSLMTLVYAFFHRRLTQRDLPA